MRRPPFVQRREWWALPREVRKTLFRGTLAKYRAGARLTDEMREIAQAYWRPK